MPTQSLPWRAIREVLDPPISLREASRRTGINPGRLSIIERGVAPSDGEHAKLAELYKEAILAVLEEAPSS